MITLILLLLDGLVDVELKDLAKELRLSQSLILMVVFWVSLVRQSIIIDQH
jgi:hypothetical protein